MKNHLKDISIGNLAVRSLRHGSALIILAGACCLSGCFTGIEGTKKIELSREDRRSLAPSEEDLLLKDVSSAPLGEWKPGKRFMVSADKGIMIFEQAGLPVSASCGPFAGTILRFEGWDNRKALDGSEELLIIFYSDSTRYVYNTHRKPAEALEKITSANIPMMIDLDRVAGIESKLMGKRIWTVSSLWYDDKGERKVGRKFVPVVVKGVQPGDSVFPVRICFAPDNLSLSGADRSGGRFENSSGTWSMLMNYGGDESGSRPFKTLFSLSDPRSKHKSISDEVWEKICCGLVMPGMTKEECRLSLGSPADTDTGHNYSTLLDIWRYADGRVLRFADGVLVDVRY